MKAEIITSGTELLLGDVTDTNTPFLARELAAIGIHVYHHTTVGDNPKRLLEAIQIAEDRADIVIVSGGLGPTDDDITKSILAEHLDTNLVVDEESLEKVIQRYETEDISEGNYRQAMVLEGSTPLKNDIGMAAGIYIEKEGNIYVLLPGVPNEFEHMVTNHLLPLLTKKSSKNYILRSRNLNFYGLPEAKIAEKLSKLIENQTNPTIAIYAKSGIIQVRVTASAPTEEQGMELLDEMEKRILAILGNHFFGYNTTRLQDVVFEELAVNNETLSIIEIHTDGEVVDGLVHNIPHKEAFKGGLYFTQHADAEKYFSQSPNTENPKKTNEGFAKHAVATFDSDYGLAVTGLGENKRSFNRMPETAIISIATKGGEVYTKEIDLQKRTYFARWLLPLKVSDTIRRFLLDLPQLEENY
ncbi:MAG TPA: CinA family nicotinamide mononucleotide deamidase-related protein [Atopostipes sp.]|nr:CinA family nicotinamide mononucleotide deamidase-related protein [Atopostipes sp.]